jgi:hypothetical protein
MSGTRSVTALAMRAMITAGHRARMIQVAAKLGIADILGRGPADPGLLAEESGCDVVALGRLLRALAASGVFSRAADGAWQLTELGETLCVDSPASCRAAALYWGFSSVRSAWDNPEYSIPSGSSDVACLSRSHAGQWQPASPCLEQRISRSLIPFALSPRSACCSHTLHNGRFPAILLKNSFD